MEYTENLAVFERVLLYNRIQTIKKLQEDAEQDQINQAKSQVEGNKSKS